VQTLLLTDSRVATQKGQDVKDVTSPRSSTWAFDRKQASPAQQLHKLVYRAISRLISQLQPRDGAMSHSNTHSLALPAFVLSNLIKTGQTINLYVSSIITP
jgi:hypothetical protein